MWMTKKKKNHYILTKKGFRTVIFLTLNSNLIQNYYNK